MSTYFATFPKSDLALQTVRTLLADGVRSDDISVVGRTSLAGQNSAQIGHPEDSTYIVGREDDSTASAQMTNIQEESRIGAGISTSTSDDDVASVDEMDDSQAEAEDSANPEAERLYSLREEEDVRNTVETGFPTTISSSDLAPDSDVSADGESASLDRIAIPGFGWVMGGGTLATAALDPGHESMAARRIRLRSFLQDEGVPSNAAAAFVSVLEGGGALLAVEIVPGITNPDSVQTLSKEAGAMDDGLFDAPRY